MICDFIGKIRKKLNPNRKKIDISKLPSQGYFYPDDMDIYLKRGNETDKKVYNLGLKNANIFGIINLIKVVLDRNLIIKPRNFNFDGLMAIDIFYLFIEFIKFTSDKKIYFEEIEFNSNNFVYFNFEKYINFYDSKTKEFVFDGWRFSLPSIGVESSLNKFSHEITVRGELDKYQNSNYNLIYFLGDRTNLEYNDIVNLIQSIEDIDKNDIKKINEIVSNFSSLGLYILVEEGKDPIKINTNMIKSIW